MKEIVVRTSISAIVLLAVLDGMGRWWAAVGAVQSEWQMGSCIHFNMLGCAPFGISLYI